ncbi:metallophosphoesterase [Niallia sp. XMNu-256]|uniref:metallophosphoesterase family protein n=1 Tax=Niallia sp. XMNu-256 TaxID=3082444 RepID=UPI0030CBDA5E
MRAVKYLLIIMFVFVTVYIIKDNNTESTPTIYDVISENKEVRLMIATDLHYLSPSLVEQGDLFKKVYQNGDGKQVHYISEIIDAFIAEVIKEKPDALILSGDLTLNGEKKSHQELVKKLKEVKQNGISIMVIPGNHDINNYYASGFAKKTSYPVDFIGENYFRDLYGPFGFDQAIYKILIH